MENQVEGINELNVTSWMKERIVGLKPPLNFEKIAGGHSKLTFKESDQVGNAIQIGAATVYPKTVLEKQESYFTTEVLQALDECAQKEFSYGS